MEIIRNNQPSQSGDFVASPRSKSQHSPIEYRSEASTDADWTECCDFDDGAKQPIDGLAKAGYSAITSIKPAVRDTRRVNIFIDGKFSFSLDLAQLTDYKLKVGEQLSPEKLEELISASNFGKLYQRTLEYVFSRPHSIKEVRDHLKNKQRTRQLQQRRYDEYRQKPTSNYHPKKPAAPISDQDIEKVIARLTDRGYLNDANFARYFIENRNLKKGISTKRLRLELRKKGIPDDLIDQALSENPRDQSEEIKKIIEKKRRRGYDDQKLIQYLLRQGFDYELVRNSVLSEMD